MKSIQEISKKYDEDLSAVDEYCRDLYEHYFDPEFKLVRELQGRMYVDDYKPITDQELEMILTDIPLYLFNVSESLNSLRLRYEVIKLKTKERKLELERELDLSSEEKRRKAANLITMEDELMIKIYSSLIDRVESEISFCKELIMSAKKIWDRRKQTEEAVIQPFDPSVSKKAPKLPDYGSNM